MSESSPFDPLVREGEPSPTVAGKVPLPKISSYVETWSEGGVSADRRSGEHVLRYRSTLLRRVTVKAVTELEDATYSRVPPRDTLTRSNRTWIHQATIETGDKRWARAVSEIELPKGAVPSVVVQYEAFGARPYSRVVRARRTFPLS